MKIVTAPNVYIPSDKDITCFLAGGITDCHEWQNDVIASLERAIRNGVDLDHLVILNPRRENFPIDNPNVSEEQIKWEYEMLEQCDIFSMYFASGNSVQPICLYEFGRYVARMMEKHPLSWRERLVISVENGYKRKQDVLIQSKLAIGKEIVLEHATPQDHAHDIIMSYTWTTEEL